MTQKPQKALESMLEQGFAQLREGQFEEAIETFSTSHALEANDDRALRGRGLAFSQLGDAVSAEKDFRNACEHNRSEPENLMGLGMSLAMQNNKIYESIKIYEELIGLHPNFVAGYLQMGRLQLKVGAISKGKEYLKKALNFRPTLVQRRVVEALLKEQEKLDKSRYYRPDFEQLNKNKGESALSGFLRNLIGRFKKKVKSVKPDSGKMSQV